MVMSHLQAGPPKAALDVEALVGLAAIKNCLVASHLFGDVVERLDEAQTQLLALLVLSDGDILDVTNRAEVVDTGARRGVLAVPCEPKEGDCFLQLAFRQQTASTDDPWWAGGGVLDDENEVAAVLPRNPVVALLPLLFRDIADCGENPQAVEEAGVEVVPTKRAQLVTFGQGGLHLGRQVLG